MTDNEILKALECCGIANCDGCPFADEEYGCKDNGLTLFALDLINRLEAEVEQWKEEANRYQTLWCEAENDLQTAKAEAYKEFAERLKTETKGLIGANFIDNLVKEMVGEQDA